MHSADYRFHNFVDFALDFAQKKKMISTAQKMQSNVDAIQINGGNTTNRLPVIVVQVYLNTVWTTCNTKEGGRCNAISCADDTMMQVFALYDGMHTTTIPGIRYYVMCDKNANVSHFIYLCTYLVDGVRTENGVWLSNYNYVVTLS